MNEKQLRGVADAVGALCGAGPGFVSEVIGGGDVLRVKSQINGCPKLQGVFAMKDREGFPVDMSYEIAKENGCDVDWIEALADALRQDILKFDALLAEMMLLVPAAEVAAIEKMFGVFLMGCEGATASDRASHLYSKMRW